MGFSESIAVSAVNSAKPLGPRRRLSPAAISLSEFLRVTEKRELSCVMDSHIGRFLGRSKLYQPVRVIPFTMRSKDAHISA